MLENVSRLRAAFPAAASCFVVLGLLTACGGDSVDKPATGDGQATAPNDPGTDTDPGADPVADTDGTPDAGVVPGETDADMVDPVEIGPQPVPESDKTAANYPELKIETLAEGEGDPIEKGQTGKFHYEGMLLDGTRFDASHGKSPIPVTLGSGGVIRGWDLGLVGMKVGEKRRLQIPSDLAYGASAKPSIPAHSDLVFYVECVEIESN